MVTAAAPSVKAAPGASLPALLLVATYFALAAGNGYRLWLSSFPFVVVLALLAVVVQARGETEAPAIRGFTGWVVAAVGTLAIAAASSWLATLPDADSSLAFVGSYLSPLLVAVAMLGRRWEEGDLWRVAATILVGGVIVLAHGIFRFYAEFGIPTGLDLIFARAQEVRIEPYLRATWGNVGSTAAYLALVLPMALAISVWRDAPRLVRRLSQLFIVLALLNFAVIQSRTLLLVMTASLIVVARAFQTRLRTVLMVVVVVLAVLMIPLFTVLDTLFAYLAGTLQGASGDASVGERTEAMQIGWQMMWDSPLQGIGPGRSLLLNPYTSAHEFLVELGSELGVAGFIAAALATAATWHVLRGALVRGRTPAGRLGIVLSIGPAGYMLYAFLANAPLSQGAVSSWAGLWAGLLTLAAGWLDRIDGDQLRAANDDRRGDA